MGDLMRMALDRASETSGPFAVGDKVSARDRRYVGWYKGTIHALNYRGRRGTYKRAKHIIHGEDYDSSDSSDTRRENRWRALPNDILGRTGTASCRNEKGEILRRAKTWTLTNHGDKQFPKASFLLEMEYDHSSYDDIWDHTSGRIKWKLMTHDQGLVQCELHVNAYNWFQLEFQTGQNSWQDTH